MSEEDRQGLAGDELGSPPVPPVGERVQEGRPPDRSDVAASGGREQQAELPFDDAELALALEDEVRLAVVLYGGVSLAIYMYGVAEELWRLVRSTCPAEPLLDPLNPPEKVRR